LPQRSYYGNYSQPCEIKGKNGTLCGHANGSSLEITFEQTLQGRYFFGGCLELKVDRKGFGTV
jgi:hypothetical protein